MKVKIMVRKLLLSVIFAFVLCSSSQAKISEQTVISAWKRISEADKFPTVKINFENEKSPNAWVKFKSQNKYSVHVTRGLMQILDTEEQIAAVLGHEIGHVRLGHYNKGVGRNVGWAVLGGLLGAVKGNAGVAARLAGQAGMNLAESGFSRGQEVEADDYGVALSVKAGYSSYGLYRAMKAFADNKIITSPNGFNSHPPTARRLKHLLDKAKELENK